MKVINNFDTPIENSQPFSGKDKSGNCGLFIAIGASFEASVFRCGFKQVGSAS